MNLYDGLLIAAKNDVSISFEVDLITGNVIVRGSKGAWTSQCTMTKDYMLDTWPDNAGYIVRQCVNCFKDDDMRGHERIVPPDLVKS
jgi:hypothetical protein